MQRIVILFMVSAFLTIAMSVTAATSLQSLRGEDIPAGSREAAGMDWKSGDTSIARTFVHQPPLIPHAIDEYKITTEKNDCLDCHGDKDSGAPVPHASHFVDRDNKKTDKVSSRWHFCTQCHVGQVDANPLVENTFQGK